MHGGFEPFGGCTCLRRVVFNLKSSTGFLYFLEKRCFTTVDFPRKLPAQTLCTIILWPPFVICRYAQPVKIEQHLVELTHCPSHLLEA